MKFCAKCGAELFDEAVICVKCGCPTECGMQFQQPAATTKNSGLSTAAKVLMIITTVYAGLCTLGIALSWMLPMTISYSRRIKDGRPIGTGFKVCSLLFVNTIAGILMLCDNEH